MDDKQIHKALSAALAMSAAEITSKDKYNVLVGAVKALAAATSDGDQKDERREK